MKEKFVVGTLLMLVLASIVVFAFNIQQVEGWTGTVYIKSDGSIDPLDAPISISNNETYTLTDNITSYGDGIIVQRDNAVIDGAGYSVQGHGGSLSTGMDVQSRTNVTVRGIEIRGFKYAMYLGQSSSLNVSGNRIEADVLLGLCVSDCSNLTLAGNVITGKTGLEVSGMQFSHFVHDIDTSNTVNGKPVYYLINQRDLVVNSSTFPNIGYLALVNSTDITVDSLNFTGNGQGVLFAYTEDSTIKGNQFTDNGDGISFVGSSNNSICNNNASANRGRGIHLDWSSSNNSIYDNCIAENVMGVGIDVEHQSSFNNIWSNNITGHEMQGIMIFWAPNNTIIGNTLSDNVDGIRLTSTSNTVITGNNLSRNRTFSIYLERGGYNETCNNTISGNIITDTLYHGIRLEGYGDDRVTNNHIYLNNVTNSGEVGISLAAASDNMIYKNNFVNNTVQVQSPFALVNTWDDGVEGNYWSDYNGTGPYVINADNQDNHPLAEPIVISEFPSAIILPLFAVFSLIASVFARKKRHC